MINDTQPRLATTIAGYSQASRTCDRRHVSMHDSGSGGFLLRIVLICCCITVTCGSKLNMRHGKNFKEILALIPSKHSSQRSQMGYCDLDIECDWSWNETQGFKKVKALRTSSRSFPATDANNSSNGTKTLSHTLFSEKIDMKSKSRIYYYNSYNP